MVWGFYEIGLRSYWSLCDKKAANKITVFCSREESRVINWAMLRLRAQNFLPENICNVKQLKNLKSDYRHVRYQDIYIIIFIRNDFSTLEKHTLYCEDTGTRGQYANYVVGKYFTYFFIQENERACYLSTCLLHILNFLRVHIFPILVESRPRYLFVQPDRDIREFSPRGIYFSLVGVWAGW